MTLSNQERSESLSLEASKVPSVPAILFRVFCLILALHLVLPLPHVVGQDKPLRNTLESALSGSMEVAAQDDPDIRRLLQSIAIVRGPQIPSTRELHAYFEGLETLAARNLDWPWPGILISAMLRRLAVSGQQLLPFPGVPEGLSWAEAFFTHLRRVIERDPSYVYPRQLALDAMERAGERRMGDEELAVLRRELSHPVPLPLAFLIQARLERQEGRSDRSLEFLQRASGHRSVDAGVLALEFARTLRGLGRREEARTAYFSGLRNLTALGRDAYLHDLTRIVHPDSLPALDSVPGSQIEDFVRTLWALRDALGAHRPGERLDQHLERWVVAHAVFRLHAPWRRTQYRAFTAALGDNCVGPERDFLDLLWRLQPARHGDLRWQEQLLDHRGLALMRHGRPYARVIGQTPGKPSGSMENRVLRYGLEIGDDYEQSERLFNGAMSESWLMHFEGRWRFLFFRPGEVLGYYAPTTMTTFLPAVHWDYESLATLLSDYREAARKLATVGMTTTVNHEGILELADAPGNCIPAATRVIGNSRVDARLMVGSDSDEPRLERRWAAAMRLYALDHGARSVLTLVAAIPESELTNGVRGVPLRLSLFDSREGRLTVIDTMLPLTERQASYAYGSTSHTVADGTYIVGALVGQESSGGIHLSSRLSPARTAGLRMSQLLLGHENVPIRFPFAGQNFPLTPFEFWARETPLIIGYEVSGGPRDGEVEVITEVLRPRESGSALRVSRRERLGSDGSMQRVIRLGLRNLDEGRYMVRVIVRHQGAEGSAQQAFAVTK